MPKKKNNDTVSGTPSLTKEGIIRAATNDPTFSPDQFTLGDRTFKVVDLSYDEYTKFLVLIAPLVDGVMGKVTSKLMSNAPEITDDFSVKTIFQFCGDKLPELATIVCRATDPFITTEDVKRLGKNPFVLADIVFMQIARNNMIKDVADFFQRILPLVVSRKSATKE